MARTRVPMITPRSYISGEGRGRRDLTNEMNRRLPNVRARQEGGYSDVGIPNPNSAMALQGLYQSGAAPTHLGGGMSSSEYNAANANIARERSEAERRRDPISTRQIGGPKSSKGWDAFFGGLQATGADELQSGAAAGMDMGSSVYDMRTGTSYQQARPGFFDTQVGKQYRAYDPKDMKAGELPEDSIYGRQQRNNAEAARQALGGLFDSGSSRYDSQAGSVLRRRIF